MTNRNFPFLLSIAFFVIAIDQLSKFLVRIYTLFPIYLNHDIAFSLPVPWYLPWIVLFSLGIFYLYQNFIKVLSMLDSAHRGYLYSWGMIVGGGVSNVIDRIFHSGAVIDFIKIGWWPVFNLADCAIVTGVVLSVWYMYYNPRITTGN